MTKEDLIKENAILKSDLERFKTLDEQWRRELSELLDNFVYSQDRGTHQTEKKVEVCSWLKIAFLIGEFKADADYSVTLQAREELKRENAELKQRIYELERPTSYWSGHKDLKFCASKEAFDEAWFSTHPFHRIAQLMPQMWQIDAAHIAQLDPFQLLPQALSRVQLRGIGRQAL
jgi:hypothetical protein